MFHHFTLLWSALCSFVRPIKGWFGVLIRSLASAFGSNIYLLTNPNRVIQPLWTQQVHKHTLASRGALLNWLEELIRALADNSAKTTQNVSDLLQQMSILSAQVSSLAVSVASRDRSGSASLSVKDSWFLSNTHNPSRTQPR